ncbi:MAG: LamG-like jellyroll fold domain-containing protein [Alphaproteobacteria bacterium]
MKYRIGGLIKVTVVLTVALGMVGQAHASLIAHWDFEAGFTDIVGGFGGAAQGDTVLVAGGQVGASSAFFDGAGDYVSTNFTPLYSQTDSFTWAAWIRPQNLFNPGTSNPVTEVAGVEQTASGEARIGIYHPSNQQITVGKAFGGVRDDSGNQGGVFGQTVIYDGDWHHVVLIRDSDNNLISLYVDGVLDLPGGTPATDITTTDINANSMHDLFIGGSNHNGVVGEPFQGLIDDFRIYDMALTPEQVGELFANEVPEPATWAILVGALSLLRLIYRRRGVRA